MTASLALVEPGADQAPDFAAPVEGWRVWRVGMLQARVVLKSLFVGTIWEPTVPLVADCTQGHRARWRPWRIELNDHPSPELDCRCGIYAVRSVAMARSYLERPDLLLRDERVIGRVALWGTVVEGKHGWRASRAYPIELFVPTPAVVRSGFRRRAHVEQILMALEEYGVPVDVIEPSGLTAPF
jgi:hypothetical protein